MAVSTTLAVLQEVRQSTRIRALDGWRGIAILLVLVDHFQFAFLGHSVKPWTQTGQHGVTLFFVLSGFVITMKLMEGGSLRSFYVRRFFRLMPVAWLYLALMAILHFVHRADVVSCVFFFRNYCPLHHLADGHFWSLSIEEQFYLVWPCLLLLAGIKRARWIAIFGALLCASYRLAMWGHYDHLWANFRTEVRVDALMVGCLLALVFPHVKAACNRFVIPALLVFAFCIIRYQCLTPLYEDIAIAALLGASAASPRNLISRLTSFRPLVWIGVVSYSVYVWQEIFFIHVGFGTTMILVCIMPAFAVGSYYGIERPCNRIGYKLAHRLDSLTPARRSSDDKISEHLTPA